MPSVDNATAIGGGPAGRPRRAVAEFVGSVPAVLVAAVLVALMLGRIAQVRRVNVNWDEFYFLSRIHEALRGDLSDAFLTFHARLLAWVPLVVDGELPQVFVLRGVMVALTLVTIASTTFIGHRLADSKALALLGTLAGQALGYVVIHGFAARFDPPLVALCTTTLALLLARRRAALIVAAGCYALAFLITLKAGLYAPTVAAFLLLRPTERRVVDGGVFVVVGGVVFGGLLGLHRALLAPLPAVVVASDGRSVGSMLQRALPGGLVLQEKTLATTLDVDPLLWAALAGAIVVVIVVALVDRARRVPALLALSLVVPLLAVAGYRNAFAYFYVSVFPTAAVTIGVAAGFLARRLPRRPLADVGVAVVVVVAALAFVRPAVIALVRQKNEVAAARAVLAAVHQVFPRPVPYIDRCGMVAAYPKVGPFMSTWGLQAYREAGRADVKALLTTRAPQFVLANVASLRLEGAPDDDGAYRLLPDDAAALRESFVQHWGPLWVAGHRVEVPATGTTSFSNLIVGRYRVETGEGVIALDGARVGHGDVVALAVGPHTVAAVDGHAATLVLKTVEAGPAPPRAPPTKGLFSSLSRARQAEAD